MALPSGQFKKIIYVCVISMCPRVSVNYISENCYWTNQSGGECVFSSYEKLPSVVIHSIDFIIYRINLF